MGVSVHVTRQGAKRYRVRRVINGMRVCEVFPLTPEGFAEATELDKLWESQQRAARLEQLKEPVLNDKGFLKGMYFHVRKNKIGPDNIYIRMRYPNGDITETIVRDNNGIFDFIVNNLPIYKEIHSDEIMSMGFYFLTAEKLFPAYKKEFLRLKKLVELDFKEKTKIIQRSLEKQKLLEGKV
jgi:hypothetical protein